MTNAGDKLVVRVETAADIHAVRKLNKKAFKGNSESKLVDAIREADYFIPGFSIVAEKGGVIVGHILFSPIKIKDEAVSTPALALAPMAVSPEFQNQGVGSALIKFGLEECRKAGHKIIVVVGHDEYYPRFGFVRAIDKGLKLPFEAPDEVFMALELVPGALTGVKGMVEYPAEFHAIS